MSEQQTEVVEQTAVEDLPLLDRIIVKGRMARDDSQRVYAGKLLNELAVQVLDEKIQPGDGVAAMINARIEEIDRLVSAQLNAVLHAQPFQELEAAWRGLHYLVKNTETGSRLKLRVLNLTKDELRKDLEKAVDIDQSQLFKKVYEEEYGTYGGAPFSVLIGDYSFGRTAPDLSILKGVAGVAAAAHAPFIAGAAPGLFDMDSFTELGTPRDLAKIFDSAELISWRNSFRGSEDSRYIALVLPRVLLRLPYGPKTIPVEQFAFQESVDGRDHSAYLWGNAAYALAVRITSAVAQHAWPAAIRGPEGGGKVEGLPNHVFDTEEGDKAAKCPTEVAITDRREKELSDLGFISLCHCKGTDFAAFFGGSSTQAARSYNTDQANANARISAQLPYVLAASRFAHYVKVIMRDKVGSFLTRSNVSEYLNRWIADYVLLSDDAPQSAKAQFPLREARVDVTEVPGKPGSYKATVFLRPHFQLEELTVSMRLVAELPPPAA